MERSGSTASRGHQRTGSAAIASRPRSSTKGPLDANDAPLPSPAFSVPLSPRQAPPPRFASPSGIRASSPAPPTPGLPPRTRSLVVGAGPPHRTASPSPLASPSFLPSSSSSSPRSSSTRRAAAAAAAAAVMATATAPQKDFSHLLRPEIYHPLTALNLPPPFRSPASSTTKQPTPDTPIPDLLARGHFRAAAVSAARQLTDGASVSPTDHARILDLLYVRLACLTLLPPGSAGGAGGGNGGGAAIAAQEARALEDPNAARYLDDVTGAHLAPWPLRVLLVRLQALGFGDPRRAVMAYYDLAREARVRLAAVGVHARSKQTGGKMAPDAVEAERRLWRDRLADLGVRVAGALVEMDDLAGAAHHLATMKAWPGDGDGKDSSKKLDTARALLWLHLGDVDAARSCIGAAGAAEGEGEGEGAGESVVAALCDMADGEYATALEKWRLLREQRPRDEMVAVNMAVCLLYLGRMAEGKDVLESLVDAGHSSHPLLFNLTTMYELSTERARERKLRLAERVAAMDESPRGWERANVDFKLD